MGVLDSAIDDYEEETQIRGITSSMEIKAQMEKYLEIKNVPKEEWKEYLEVGIEGLNTELAEKVITIKESEPEPEPIIETPIKQSKPKINKPKINKPVPKALSNDIDFSLPEVEF